MIIVSPLKRTLETAYQMFKEHPNFENIQVILDPDLREHIFCRSCDIPDPIEETVYYYKALFNHFDASLIDLASDDCNLWFLKNGDLNTYEKFKKVPLEGESYLSMFHEYMLHNGYRESNKSKMERAERSKKLIKKMLRKVDEDG